jgi:hypothetical protein
MIYTIALLYIGDNIPEHIRKRQFISLAILGTVRRYHPLVSAFNELWRDRASACFDMVISILTPRIEVAFLQDT